VLVAGAGKGKILGCAVAALGGTLASGSSLAKGCAPRQATNGPVDRGLDSM